MGCVGLHGCMVACRTRDKGLLIMQQHPYTVGLASQSYHTISKGVTLRVFRLPWPKKKKSPKLRCAAVEEEKRREEKRREEKKIGSLQLHINCLCPFHDQDSNPLICSKCNCSRSLLSFLSPPLAHSVSASYIAIYYYFRTAPSLHQPPHPY